ncbi:hypothetical protein DEO72_LG5g372 [Vigna unguiculata]|uniref:Uncharacterized protein n=1 Tax=Vigna unguiculata TaxID=3917 RepID=A0A4D6LV44_VIGUN|nr:hypothetical protein DEO72_LG5g372 [Vigna unguiculata]
MDGETVRGWGVLGCRPDRLSGREMSGLQPNTPQPLTFSPSIHTKMLPISMNGRRNGEGLGCIGLQTGQALGERDVRSAAQYTPAPHLFSVHSYEDRTGSRGERCQVCSPIHPSPSPFLRPFIRRWVVARRGRTPDLSFNTLLTRQMLPISMNGRRNGEGLGCIGLQTGQALGERDVRSAAQYTPAPHLFSVHSYEDRTGSRGERCQVCSPIHPSPSPFLRPFIRRWVVARRGRTPDLSFNTLLTRQMLPISMNGRRNGEGLGCIGLQTGQALGERDVRSAAQYTPAPHLFSVHSYEDRTGSRGERCQVCSPIHPSPSPFLRPFIRRWVVARRGRTPDLSFNTLLTRQMLPISMNGRRNGEGLGCIGLQTGQALGERDVRSAAQYTPAPHLFSVHSYEGGLLPDGVEPQT